MTSTFFTENTEQSFYEKPSCVRIFSIMSKHGSDIDRSSRRKWVLAIYTLEIRVSGISLNKLEKFIGKLYLIKITVLYYFQTKVLVLTFNYTIYSLIDHRCKTRSELTELLKNSPT